MNNFWWAQTNLQDAITPVMEFLIYFHDYVMVVISSITMIIFYIILTLIVNKHNNKFILQNQTIEIIWTVIPIIILLFVAIPSLQILYMADDIFDPQFTIKTIGHQWYWSYEYTDFATLIYDSYMLKYNENSGMFRLLDVDNRMVIPHYVQIRIITTSADVIHSWTVPALGVKMDSIPGRLNQALIYVTIPGVFYGQCSEICGMNHSFMPIVIESIPIFRFLLWLYVFNGRYWPEIWDDFFFDNM